MFDDSNVSSSVVSSFFCVLSLVFVFLVVVFFFFVLSPVSDVWGSVSVSVADFGGLA